MDALDMVMVGITVWVVLSGPVALLIGQLLRRRSELIPVPAPTVDDVPIRMLLSASR